MQKKILVFLLLARAACSSNYYPFQQQFFSHQSQSLYQGQSGLGFGFHPAAFSRPQNTGGGAQIVITGGSPGIQGGHGQGPIYIPGGGGVHGGNGVQFVVPESPGHPQGIHGGNQIVIHGGGAIHGGNGPIFIPGGAFQGGNGFGQVGIPGGIHGGNYPGFPYPIQFPIQKPCCDHNLKPSITGWDTAYTVPCGTYNIYPFVTARIRYTAGSHAAERIAKSAGQQRQDKSLHHYHPFQSFPGTSCDWNFHASGCKLKFSCSYLQLPALFQCDENVMEYNDTLKYFKYCGSSSRKVHEPLISDSGQLRVTFKSRAFALPSVINCSVICTPEIVYPQQSTNVLNTEKPVEKKPEPKPLKYGNCKCGVRRSVSAGRIVGGKRTFPGEFPWTVALVKKNSNRPFCGGSLINNRFVLTAAHCVQTRKPSQNAASEIQVLLNEHDVSKVNSVPGGRLRVGVREIVIHPKYDKITYDFDIALLQLDTSIDFELKNCRNSTSEFARMQNEFDAQFIPVCLPLKAKNLELENQEAIVTGWGLTQEGGNPANAMMQATVSIFNDTACRGFYETTDIITNQMMCVGHPEGKEDSCVGDSGGPLVVSKNESYTLAGIVSWGRGCGRPKLPGVYTRMIGLTDWVTEKSADAVWCEP